MPQPQSKKIEIRRPNIQRMKITLVGLTPLMTARKTDAMKKGIIDSAPGKKGMAKKVPPRTPEEQYADSMYKINKTTHGFPAGSVKSAEVSVLGGLKETGNGALSMKRGKAMFSIFPEGHHELMKLRFKRVEQSDDWAVIPKTGTPVPVSRAVYYDWSCDCIVQFDADLLDPETILALVMKAGQVGIGAWRPEKGGNKGTFEVKQAKESKKKRAA